MNHITIDKINRIIIKLIADRYTVLYFLYGNISTQNSIIGIKLLVAISKCIIIYESNAVRNSYVGKTLTMCECVSAYRNNTSKSGTFHRQPLHGTEAARTGNLAAAIQGAFHASETNTALTLSHRTSQ